MGFSNLAGPISVIRKCGGINGAGNMPNLEKVNVRAQTSVNDEREVSDCGVGKEKGDNTLSVDNSNVASETHDIESQKSDLKGGHCQPGRKHGPGLLATSGNKHPHSQLLRLNESEQDVDNNNGKYDSVTAGGRRNRQQTAPGQNLYNFRHQTVSGTATGGQDFDCNKQYESQFSYEGTNPSAMNPDVACTPSFEATTESGRRSNFVQVSTAESIQFSSDKFDKIENHVVESVVDEVKSTENSLLGGEANSAEMRRQLETWMGLQKMWMIMMMGVFSMRMMMMTTPTMAIEVSLLHESCGDF